LLYDTTLNKGFFINVPFLINLPLCLCLVLATVDLPVNLRDKGLVALEKILFSLKINIFLSLSSGVYVPKILILQKILN
jgi:hypothetical protein